MSVRQNPRNRPVVEPIPIQSLELTTLLKIASNRKRVDIYSYWYVMSYIQRVDITYKTMFWIFWKFWFCFLSSVTSLPLFPAVIIIKMCYYINIWTHELFQSSWYYYFLNKCYYTTKRQFTSLKCQISQIIYFPLQFCCLSRKHIHVMVF